jgi:hypothetical protein
MVGQTLYSPLNRQWISWPIKNRYFAGLTESNQLQPYQSDWYGGWSRQPHASAAW